MTGLHVIEGKMMRLPIPFFFRSVEGNHRHQIQDATTETYYTESFKNHWSSLNQLIRLGIYEDEIQKVIKLFTDELVKKNVLPERALQTSLHSLSLFKKESGLLAYELSLTEQKKSTTSPSRHSLLYKAFHKGLHIMRAKTYLLNTLQQRRNKNENFKKETLVMDNFKNYVGKNLGQFDQEFTKIKSYINQF